MLEDFFESIDYIQYPWREREQKLLGTGYLARYLPEHPNNHKGWMLEHRLVMEEHWQRFIKRGATVHHINEDKHCNKIWNLFLCTPEEHTLIHKMGMRHNKKVRAKMSTAHKQQSKKRKRNFQGQFV